ncbi:MAG: sulfurtransferase TusA [Gammaproteobacteria bacterium]|nr:sulfurtransferase TusA [Gammaproteobacteria bacterium]MDP2141009.1 sulfurtransferase TusA [Gammaproteobacteria bacterium]MDP2349247.1 sulfurtransferase TusA [Gammaproteobacteria bacterium]
MSDSKNNATDEILASTHLDACGLFCPEPVMLLHNRIRDMARGDVLELVATDPSTTRDVPKFCLFLGHELISKTQKDDRYYYLIRKK